MKKLLFLALITGVTLLSCSKKSNNPVSPAINTKVIITDTVTIGTQTWTSLNYNGDGGVNYNNGSNNPDYGKLYTLSEAKSLILPNGWRIPSTEDFNKLMGYLGATLTDSTGYYISNSAVGLKLMSDSQWTLMEGTNNSGFNAYPAGYYHYGFAGQTTNAVFVTTSLLPGYGVPANFSLNEVMVNNGIFIGTAFTDQIPQVTDRGSLRFVKEN